MPLNEFFMRVIFFRSFPEWYNKQDEDKTGQVYTYYRYNTAYNLAANAITFIAKVTPPKNEVNENVGPAKPAAGITGKKTRNCSGNA